MILTLRVAALVGTSICAQFLGVGVAVAQSVVAQPVVAQSVVVQPVVVQPVTGLAGAVTATHQPPAKSARREATTRGGAKSRRRRHRARRRQRRARRRRQRRHQTGAVTVFGRRARRAKIAGSAYVVGAKQLERYEHDDIHRALAEVPGVYVREEDGYGLRPNIGMRGASAERSAKITLMEDGVLIAPAPYAAPAAYYFPVITRMTGLEVIKGPAGIRFGPSTVGGALNLVSAPVPNKRTFLIDLSGGTTKYGKAHVGYGDRTKHVGWWVEAVGLRSDGFKELDGGGSTGFAKWEGVAKLSLNSGASRRTVHALHLRVDAGNERSNETYTGLSDADFRANPWRRYAGTQQDLLTWQRWSARARYELRLGEDVSINVTAYRNQFTRTWAKLSGFAVGKSVDAVLRAPTKGSNAVLYGVLTGAQDSTDPSEALILGTNARSYLAQGIQAQLSAGFAAGSLGKTKLKHELIAGARLHSDTVERNATEATRLMQGGKLSSVGSISTTRRDATAEALALALWAQDTVELGKLRVSAGLRLELVQTTWTDHLDKDGAGQGSNGQGRNGQGRVDKDNNGQGRVDKDSFSSIIPGFSLLYTLRKGLAVLAGVHKGFSPVSPGQAKGTQPEQSWNYEAGVRFNKKKIRAEVIGFFNNYSNLKGTCSFSSGCSVGDVGQEFNGGQVWIYGVEATAGTLLGSRKSVRVPLSVTYTLTQSRFQAGFTSGNPQWGVVKIGDALPYVPVHQLAVNTGLRGKRWQLALSGRYVAPMRDRASQGDAGTLTDTTLVFDAAVHVRLGAIGKVYFTAKNLLDSAQVVSYRPFGARPGIRRLLMVGLKRKF